jgi:hypothetical protein
MAKNDKAAPTQAGLALAPTEPTSALAQPMAVDDLLAVAGLDNISMPETGFGEYTAADLKIPALVFNAKGMNAQDEEVRSTEFLHTVSRQTRKSLRLTVIGVHKSNAWTEFDQDTGKTNVRCESWDTVTGTMADGSTRACKGCSDAEWKNINGKRTKRCANVDNVAVVDRDTAELSMMRFKKTSLRPWRDFLQKFFLGKRPMPGKPPVDYPGFIFETHVKLELAKGAKVPYALPVFDVARDAAGKPVILPRAEIELYAQMALGMREQLADMRESARAADAATSEENAHDASFDFADTTAENVDPAAGGDAGGLSGLAHE